MGVTRADLCFIVVIHPPGVSLQQIHFVQIYMPSESQLPRSAKFDVILVLYHMMS